jgi:hypothetical protein
MEEDQVESPTTIGALWKGYVEACLPGAPPEDVAAFRGCFYSACLGVYGLLDFISRLDEGGDKDMANEMMQCLEKELEEHMLQLNATPSFEA